MKHILLFVVLQLSWSFSASGQYRGGSDDGASAYHAGSRVNVSPDIYMGGQEDGLASARFGNNHALPGIYAGGAGDGAAILQAKGFQHTLPDIYSGGTDDGTGSFAARGQSPLPQIYAGGMDDGTSLSPASGLNGTPPIYLGGGNDGFDMAHPKGFHQELPAIYAGGGDDGFTIMVSLRQNSDEPARREVTRYVSLMRLTGVWANNDAVLHVEISRVDGIRHYELERSYDRGMNFTPFMTIGFSEDSSRMDQNYSDVGAYAISAGFLLYRLKYVDENGGEGYSPLVRLSKDDSGPQIVAYPNPTAGSFTLAMLQIQDPESYTLLLTSPDGKVIKRAAVRGRVTALDLSGHPPAAYHLFISREGKPVQHFTILLTP